VDNIGIDIDILEPEISVNIDIGKGEIDPALIAVLNANRKPIFGLGFLFKIGHKAKLIIMQEDVRLLVHVS